MKAVENGTMIANRTAQTLTEIVNTTTATTKLVGEISTACAEQAEAIEQINVGVDQISSVVQTNSATSEECAASAQELSVQANLLDEMVSSFTIDEELVTREEVTEDEEPSEEEENADNGEEPEYEDDDPDADEN